jgi:hypothetical protein
MRRPRCAGWRALHRALFCRPPLWWLSSEGEDAAFRLACSKEEEDRGLVGVIELEHSGYPGSPFTVEPLSRVIVGKSDAEPGIGVVHGEWPVL